MRRRSDKCRAARGLDAARAEALEPRTLLSTLVINGTPGDDNITLGVNSAGGVEVVANAVKTDYAPGQWSDVVLDSGTGNDAISVQATVVPTALHYRQTATINVGDARGVQDIKARLLADGSFGGPTAGGVAAVHLDDTGDSTARSVLLAFNPADQEAITGLAPAEIDLGLTVEPVTAQAGLVTGDSLHVTTGSGDDSVTVQGLRGNLPATIDSSGGNDLVNIGGGSLAQIHSDLSIGAQGGKAAITVDGSHDTAATWFDLSNNGAANNEPMISFAPAGLSNGPLIRFMAQDAASVVIDGGSGANAFAIEGTPLAPGAASGPTVTINTGDGGDAVLIDGTSAGTQLNINGGAGDDSITVSPFDANIAGSISIDGGGGNNNIAVFGALYPSPTVQPPQPPGSIRLTAGQIDRGTTDISYTNVATIHLEESSAFEAAGDLGPITLVVGTSGGLLPFATSVQIDTTQHLHELDVLPGASAIVSAGGGKVLNLDVLSIPPASGSFASGKLDLADNSMQVHYGGTDPFIGVRQMIFDGRVTSSSGNASHNLGYADSADGIVGGLAANTVLVKFTLKGDANLDGSVNFADLVLLARNYGKSDANWDQGDFNYDGHVGFDDLVLLGRNYGQSLPRAQTLALAAMAAAAMPRLRG